MSIANTVTESLVRSSVIIQDMIDNYQNVFNKGRVQTWKLFLQLLRSLQIKPLQQIKSSKNASRPDISSGFGTLSATFSALK
jgi:hypothetical protein